MGTHPAEQPITLQKAGQWLDNIARPLRLPLNKDLRRWPILRHYFLMCDSPIFWRYWPWVFVVLLNLASNFFALLYCCKYFAFNEQIMLAWLYNWITALVLGLLGVHT